MTHLSRYQVIASSSRRTYRFVSTGPKGDIKKVVQFTPLVAAVPTCNLGFGDEVPDGAISDLSVSDNEDMRKVLATIADIVLDFTDRYPFVEVYFTGSTRQRILLYHRAISSYQEELEKDFAIFGLEGEIVMGNRLLIHNREPFRKEGNYTAFIAVRKRKESAA